MPNPSRENKFSGTNGDREMFIFPVQLTTSGIGNLTRLIHTLAIIRDDHVTYSSTFIITNDGADFTSLLRRDYDNDNDNGRSVWVRSRKCIY